MSEDPEVLLRPLGDLPPDIMEDWSLGRFDSCLAKCDAILEGEENPPEMARVFRGRILSRRADHEGAIVCFQEVVEKVPVFYPVWEMLGESLLLTGNYSRALVSYCRSAKLSPSRIAPWCGAAIAAHRMNDKKGAFRILETALRVADPSQHEVALYLRAMLEEENGDVDAAFMSYLQTEMLAPDLETKKMIGEHIAMLLSRK